MQCPRCQQQNRPGAKFCDGCGISLQRPSESTQSALSYSDLQHSLTEALAREAAAGEILRVISQSPTDVQPVFQAILESATRLCDAHMGQLYLFDGEKFHNVANRGASPEYVRFVDQRGAFRPVSGAIFERIVDERRPVQLADLRDSSQYRSRLPGVVALVELGGARTYVAVPMLKDDRVVGGIFIFRPEVRPFTQKQIDLVATFASQAVIAIENVRLFNETKEALEQQTATSEILRVISTSPTDLTPVMAALVESAARLCEAQNAQIFRIEPGDQMRLVARYGPVRSTLEVNQARVVTRGSVSGRCIVDRVTLHVADLLEDVATEYPDIAQAIVRQSIRTTVGVPLLREGVPIGAITAFRTEVRPFSDQQIALLKTFADQAVIAIENVRLFKELEARTRELTRSVGELTALGAVSEALSSTLDVDVVLNTIVTHANDLIGADGCTIFEYDETAEQFHLRATRNLEPRLVELARGTPLRRGDQGILGRLPSERQPVQVPDITAGSYSSPISDALIEAGYRAVVAVPLVREGHLIGALTMNRKTSGEFPPETIQLLQTFATQSALAIQNARLFRELADKSRQLEVASQHKSEFLANMSHELRTPLNAIIGFSEVLTERMFGDLNEKQEEYLRDIYASGTHLLSLINDILDLSKIEAGRMELELTDFDLPAAIDNALTLVRERAGRRSIALHTNIDTRLGQVQADERKVRQVVLNLLSNAIKFTPEGGRIDVGAVPRDGLAEVSVSDTGVGIAPEDQEAIFEEFRQVGTAEKKAEGTGLGLTLCRKFIELHGGQIWVKSQVGAGSTFTFTIPARRAE